MGDFKIKVKNFDWHDNFSEVALEDYDMYKKELGYCAGQSIGMALTKLQLIENGELDDWIPCSVKLPDTEVICCDEYKNIMIGHVFKDESSSTGYSAENDVEFMDSVVAWMEKPEPYKGE